MIDEFVKLFDASREKLLGKYRSERPGSYESIVADVVDILSNDGEVGFPDPKRITIIDHGDYQGTLLFVIGAHGYEPSKYWSIFVDYGSCSGCDTFEAIRVSEYSEEQAQQYLTLALHMVQSMSAIGNSG